MYCPECGEQIPYISNFCMHCGKKIVDNGSGQPAQNTREPLEYEHHDIVWGAPKGKYYLATVERQVHKSKGLSEPSARLHFWQKAQKWVLLELKKCQDRGWEPVTEVGPGAIILTELPPNSNFFEVVLPKIEFYWYFIGVKIKIRRPKNT